MITNINGPLRTVQDYALEIARGRIPGAEPFGSFGELVTTGAVTNRIIWPNGPYVFPTAAGAPIEIASTNLNDTLAGTGVQKIEIHYLTADLTVGHAVVNMNGLTPVTTDADGAPLPPVRFIQCMHVEQTGTFGQGPVGTIEARDVGGLGNTYAYIAPGATRCASSARMIPKDKRAVVYGLVGSSISGTAAAQAKIQVVATELDVHQYTDQGLFIPFGSVGVQDNSAAFVLPVPGIYNPGTIVAMRATVDKAATVTGDWFGWIEDKV